MDLNTYSLMAQYYDGAYSVKSELTDLPFYLQRAQASGGPILEIACGTGRILLEIAKMGIPVTGIDYSSAMLSILRDKLAEESDEIQHRVRLFEGDMRTFSLAERFKQVFIPFRPLQHMYTIEDQISALRQAKAHLKPDGLLTFNVFYPKFNVLEAEMKTEALDAEWIDPTNPQRLVRRYFIRHSVNRLYQYFEGEFIFRTYEGDEVKKEERAPLKMSYYTYPHMQLLFKLCGLEIVEEYGSFEKDPIDICKEMIFVLRRGKD